MPIDGIEKVHQASIPYELAIIESLGKEMEESKFTFPFNNKNVLRGFFWCPNLKYEILSFFTQNLNNDD